ncbi:MULTISPECIES: signal peptidase II [Gordonia]|uniref:Lipoprotein signal peptidase n=2 Tax=Gordonia TaxID=2053 RepID=L7LGM9_9ACTN|nr:MULTISPECIES: signal peptidase II [Gordonia]AUH68783.1 signal peptidase II [Gordonia sp. YC-JH1]KJR09259.1 signal peptidase [Gordonia sihwensis]KXT58079.1 signal peptidase [Gordonia sp. QH-12]MBY4571385.1 signal peptidase II [Gordonia sihwensis]GAC60029.1 lipoprotein signal peptidase [Gordonia sihwensis NBRC 108236]
MNQPAAQRAGDPARRRGVGLIPVLIAVAVAAYLIDVLSKVLVVAKMEPGETVSVIGDFLTFHLVRNSGAAFSMATGYTWVLTFVALAVVVVIARYAKRLGSLGWVIGLGLVLGGALGNLTDRMFRDPAPLRGHVVDFIQVGSWWPTFNMADSAVVCGAVLLVVLTLLGYDYDGSRTGWAARHGSEKHPAESGEDEEDHDA